MATTGLVLATMEGQTDLTPGGSSQSQAAAWASHLHAHSTTEAGPSAPDDADGTLSTAGPFYASNG